jgi:hypothetical protein
VAAMQTAISRNQIYNLFIVLCMCLIYSLTEHKNNKKLRFSTQEKEILEGQFLTSVKNKKITKKTRKKFGSNKTFAYLCIKIKIECISC